MPAPIRKPKPLPTAAALALSEGRRIDAIKAVRETELCDLKTAASRIEETLQADPALKARLQELAQAQRKKWLPWIIVGDLLLVAGVAYWFLNR